MAVHLADVFCKTGGGLLVRIGGFVVEYLLTARWRRGLDLALAAARPAPVYPADELRAAGALRSFSDLASQALCRVKDSV